MSRLSQVQPNHNEFIHWFKENHEYKYNQIRKLLGYPPDYNYLIQQFPRIYKEFGRTYFFKNKNKQVRIKYEKISDSPSTIEGKSNGNASTASDSTLEKSISIENSELNHQIFLLRQELENANSRANSAESEVDRLKKESISIESSELNHQIIRLRQELEKVNSRAKSAESEVDRLKKDKGITEEKFRNLERDYNCLEEKLEKMGSDHSKEVQEAKKKYDEDIKNLENTLRGAEKQITELENDKQKSKNEIEKLKLQIDQATKEKCKEAENCNHWRLEYQKGLSMAKRLVDRRDTSRHAEETDLRLFVSVPSDKHDVVQNILSILGYDKCHTIVSDPDEVPSGALLHLYFAFLITKRVTKDIREDFQRFQGRSQNQIFVPISCAAKPKKIAEIELRKIWKLHKNAKMPQVLFDDNTELTIRRESITELQAIINRVFGLDNDVKSDSTEGNLAALLARLDAP